MRKSQWMAGLLLAGLGGAVPSSTDAGPPGPRNKRVTNQAVAVNKHSGGSTTKAEHYTWFLGDIFCSREYSLERLQTVYDRTEEFKPSAESLRDPAYLRAVLDRRSWLKDQLHDINVYLQVKTNKNDKSLVEDYSDIYTIVDRLTNKLDSVGALLSELPDGVLRGLAQEPLLAAHSDYLARVRHRKSYSLSPTVQQGLNSAGPVVTVKPRSYEALRNSFSFMPVKGNVGQILGKSDFWEIYQLMLYAPNATVRAEAAKSYLQAAQGYGGAAATLLVSAHKGSSLRAKLNGYPSTIHYELDRKRIPFEVFDHTIKSSEKHVSLLHRSLDLRRKALGLRELHAQDLFARLEVNEYPFEKAKAFVLSALTPLGPEYGRGLEKAFERRWLDVFPRDGKEIHAFTQGVSTHPFVLLNYRGTSDDMRTLIHEIGHAVHLHLARTQPMPKRSAWVLPTEIAASVNEDLLGRYRSRIAQTPSEGATSLLEQLDLGHRRFFLWGRMAGFLRDTLADIDKGNPVNEAKLSQRYLNGLRKYYGHEQRITRIDPIWGTEWILREPLFDDPFYHYQYASSAIAGHLIGGRIASGDLEFRDRYIDFLKAGRSAPPMKLIEGLGIDLTSNEPYDLYMKDFEQRLKEAEALVKQR